MQPLTDSFIRSSFVNASRKEVKDMTLTEGFEALTDATTVVVKVPGALDDKYIVGE